MSSDRTIARNQAGRQTMSDEPTEAELTRERHMELLEAINRQTRSVTAALEQVRDAILRSR